MNNERRKRIERVIGDLEECQNEIVSICDDEQSAYDNLPESLQYSERGDAMQSCIDSLDDAQSSIEDVISTLHDVLDY